MLGEKTMSEIKKICSVCGEEKPRVRFMRNVFHVVINKNKERVRKLEYKENPVCNTCGRKPTRGITPNQALNIYLADKTAGNKARLDLSRVVLKEKATLNTREMWAKQWDKRLKKALTDLRVVKRYVSTKNSQWNEPAVNLYLNTVWDTILKVEMSLELTRKTGAYNSLRATAGLFRNWSESLRSGVFVPIDEWLALVSINAVDTARATYKELTLVKKKLPRFVLEPSDVVQRAPLTQAEKALAAQQDADITATKTKQDAALAKRAISSRISAGRNNAILAGWPADMKVMGMKKKRGRKKKWAALEPVRQEADTFVSERSVAFKGLIDGLNINKDKEVLK
jgi:hypothetical protein